ncbi:MAG TPA: T9SS type A sorting domain-containing protein, partial [Hanamia sp.]|nr:T9SS type A sorting domain-containing protein [Hanamia sp.]
KAGQVFKIQLSENGKSVTDMKTITAMNLSNKARLRDICISPDGEKIYVSCDMSSQNTAYKGRILEYTYAGRLGVLDIKRDTIISPTRNAKIEVYPNPAKNILHVKSLKSQTSPLHYSIFDINGKLVLKGTSNTNNFGIDIQTLNPGVYIFKLYNAYFIIFVQKR